MRGTTRNTSLPPISTGQNHADERGSCGRRGRSNLTDRPIKDSEEVADGIVVDYDEEGRIVGIEILDASKRTEDPTALKQFSFEEA